MNEPNQRTSTSTSTTTKHEHFAGRIPAGLEIPVVVKKNGIRHIRRTPAATTTTTAATGGTNGKEQEILSIGLACSECFSGPRLGKLLQPGFEYEQQVMADLLAGKFASPLSNHTSGGVTNALTDFVEALEPHLPWKTVTTTTSSTTTTTTTTTKEYQKEDEDDNNNYNPASNDLDWCVSLQLEGASAVWAAIDMVLQVSMLTSSSSSSSGGGHDKKYVAVGETSYHGPPSTSFGAKCPLWAKEYQLKYPVPTAGTPINNDEYISKFQDFLDKHDHQVGVILFEPQWGSSQAAYPWPKSLLKTYISMAKQRGIRVVCDEIMCGLGRHGNGSLFVSKDWDLDPDAITFGKAIGGGVYPISGAILKRGRNILCRNGCTVMQSHTYAGSSVRALMTATAVLKEIPSWFPSIQKLGEEMGHIMRYLSVISNGMIITHGQGLMWGGLFTNEGPMKNTTYKSQALDAFKRNCEEVGILPYFVPAGGFMITPVIDIDVGTIYEIGEKLEQVVLCTMEEIGWTASAAATTTNDDFDYGNEAKEEARVVPSLSDSVPELIADLQVRKCEIILHQTKTCTSCSDFVSPIVRNRFVRYKI